MAVVSLLYPSTMPRLIRPYLIASVFAAGAAASFSPVSAAPAAPRGAPAPAPAPKRPSNLPPQAKPASGLADWTPMKALTPIASGPGVVICEPSLQPNAAGQTAFFRGCAMWLQFTVGGHGELGRTPLWSSLMRAQQELGRKDLVLNPAWASQLPKILGITHAAVGRVDTLDNDRWRLLYELYEEPASKVVGEPIQVTGSNAEIAAALPSIARTLLQRLGVQSPRVPEATGVTAEELAFLGGFGWEPERLPAGPETDRLREMSNRVPLAALLWLQPSIQGSDGDRSRACSQAFALARDNVLVPAAIGDTRRAQLMTMDEHLRKSLECFPHNSLLLWADAWRLRELREWAADQKASELLVRCTPENPEAWITLARSIGESADRIRKERLSNAITLAEWERIGKIYQRWYEATSHSVQLDAGFGRGWLRVAEAATFAGEEEAADTALWRAMDQCRENRYQIWSWGMEMYHPKWFDKPEKLAKVIQRAIEERDLGPEDAVDLAEHMAVYGFPDAARERLARTQAELAEQLRKEPEDALHHLELGDVLRAAGQKERAQSEWTQALRLDPNGEIGLAARGRLKQTPPAPGQTGI